MDKMPNPKPHPMPKMPKTMPGIVPQPRHPTGKFQSPASVYKPQSMPYMPSSTDGQ